MRRTVLSIALLLILPLAPALAQKKWTPPPQFFEPPTKAYPEDIDYGKAFWEEVQFFPAKGTARAPLVAVLVNGTTEARSGWAAWTRYRMNQAGYSVAFIPFRDKDPKAVAAIENYVKAIAFLHGKAAELELDPERILLFGYGVSGQYAILLGTDPSLLEHAGVPFASIKGVVSVAGTGFDIPRRVGESSFLKKRYERLFGKDPVVQARLSPTSHLIPPNAPAFLLLAQSDDIEARPQSEEMTRALAQAGIDAQFVALPEVVTQMRQSYFLQEPDGSGKEVVPFVQGRFES